MLEHHRGTFDLITCIYVFDSPPSTILKKTASVQQKTVSQVQNDFLLDAYDMLKPGGILFWDKIRASGQILRKDPEHGFIGVNC